MKSNLGWLATGVALALTLTVAANAVESWTSAGRVRGPQRVGDRLEAEPFVQALVNPDGGIVAAAGTADGKTKVEATPPSGGIGTSSANPQWTKSVALAEVFGRPVSCQALTAALAATDYSVNLVAGSRYRVDAWDTNGLFVRLGAAATQDGTSLRVPTNQGRFLVAAAAPNNVLHFMIKTGATPAAVDGTVCLWSE